MLGTRGARARYRRDLVVTLRRPGCGRLLTGVKPPLA